MSTKPALIASANTIGGFAIGVVSTGEQFEVVRMDRRSRFVTITRHATEAEARAQANVEYRSDMRAAA